MAHIQGRVRNVEQIDLSVISLGSLIMIMREFDSCFEQQIAATGIESEMKKLREYVDQSRTNYVNIVKHYMSRKNGTVKVTPFTFDHVNKFCQNEDDNSTIGLTAFQIAVQQAGKRTEIPVTRDGVQWPGEHYDMNAAILSVEVANDVMINAKAKNYISKMTSYGDTIFKDTESADQKTMSAMTLDTVIKSDTISVASNQVGFDLASSLYSTYVNTRAHVLMEAIDDICGCDPEIIQENSTYQVHPHALISVINKCTKARSDPIIERDALGVDAPVAFTYRAQGYGEVLCEKPDSNTKLNVFKSYTVAMGAKTKAKMISSFATGSPLGPTTYTWLKHLKLLESIRREDNQIFVLDVSDRPLALFLSHNLKSSVAYHSGTTMYEVDQKLAYSSNLPMHYNQDTKFVNDKGEKLVNIRVYLDVITGQLKSTYQSTQKYSKEALANKIADYTGLYVISAQYPCLGECTSNSINVKCGETDKPLHIGLSYNIDRMAVTLASHPDLLFNSVNAEVATAIIVCFAYNSLSYRYHAMPWPVLIKESQEHEPEPESKFEFIKPPIPIVSYFSKIEYRPIPKRLATKGIDPGLMTKGAAVNVLNVVGKEIADQYQAQLDKADLPNIGAPIPSAPPLEVAPGASARITKNKKRLLAAAGKFDESVELADNNS